MSFLCLSSAHRDIYGFLCEPVFSGKNYAIIPVSADAVHIVGVGALLLLCLGK